MILNDGNGIVMSDVVECIPDWQIEEIFPPGAYYSEECSKSTSLSLGTLAGIPCEEDDTSIESSNSMQVDKPKAVPIRSDAKQAQRKLPLITPKPAIPQAKGPTNSDPKYSSDEKKEQNPVTITKPAAPSIQNNVLPRRINEILSKYARTVPVPIHPQHLPQQSKASNAESLKQPTTYTQKSDKEKSSEVKKGATQPQLTAAMKKEATQDESTEAKTTPPDKKARLEPQKMSQPSQAKAKARKPATTKQLNHN